uniref:Uncharacterized protein n=1 Tax=Candidatus Kentrum sp. DK TaxID=2126562 RepID=A0A450SK02_9GAMM|nr:MAG: hypothetical protein BECKDK2373B_GA0170837_10447 [Candidatus Kentron sp. DK]
MCSYCKPYVPEVCPNRGMTPRKKGISGPGSRKFASKAGGSPRIFSPSRFRIPLQRTGKPDRLLKLHISRIINFRNIFVTGKTEAMSLFHDLYSPLRVVYFSVSGKVPGEAGVCRNLSPCPRPDRAAYRSFSEPVWLEGYRSEKAGNRGHFFRKFKAHSELRNGNLRKT